MTERISFNKSQRREVFNKSNGRCWYCGKRLDFSDFHIDHYYPLSLNGSNAHKNLVPACPPCNLKKKDKKPWEWRWKLEEDYGMKLSPVQEKMLRSEGFDPDLDEGEYWFYPPVLFYHHQFCAWYKPFIPHIKYKGWQE